VSRFHGETWFVDEDGLPLGATSEAGAGRPEEEFPRRYQKISEEK
jgi:hypothetical protein